MERIELVLQEQKQEVIREKYNIPKVVELKIPKRGEKLSNPLVGTVAMCPKFLDCGLRLPMQPYFVKLLPSLGGLYAIWARAGLPVPTLQELEKCFKLKNNPGEYEGWYYLSTWPKTKRLIQNLPTTNKDFKVR